MSESAARRPIRIDQAVDWALANNPDLVVRRRDLGIARAQVVIADTYPFNPVFEAQVQAADNYGLKQHIRQAYTLLQEYELGGQSGSRRCEAQAALTRTIWEVRRQEITVASQVARRFQTLLYAQQRWQLAAATAQADVQLAADVAKLFEANLASRADVILAEVEANDSGRTSSVSQTTYLTAQADFRALLGVADASQFEPVGGVEPELFDFQPDALLSEALAARPDVQAKQYALSEANAALQLAAANQRPNINFGPSVEVDEAETFFAGATLQVPLQIHNRKQGELQQAEAQRNKAVADLEQTRVKVRMEVLAAWEAYTQSRRLATDLQQNSLPRIERGLDDAQRLFAAGQIDLLKLVELRRRLLAARMQLLDALNELTLAELDLTAATGRLSFSASGNDPAHEVRPTP